MPSVLVHLVGSEPLLGEIEADPLPTDVSLVVKNPRRRDGKSIDYLDESVVTVIIPMHRVTIVEIMPSSGQEEEIISHVRE